MINLIADEIKFYNGTDGFRGIGPLGLENKASTDSFILFSTFMSSAIGLITVIAIIWFIFIIVSGSISIISSGGDKNSLEGAKKKITTGIIGLVILISSLFLLDVIGAIFGVNLLDISGLLVRLNIK